MMRGLPFLLPCIVVILTVASYSRSGAASESHGTLEDNTEKDQSNTRSKRAVGILGILGLSISVGSALQGGICTFSSICGPTDPLPQKLDELQESLEGIENSLSSLQSDVADIWHENKRSWYMDQLSWTSLLRKEVIRTLMIDKSQRNAFHKLKLQRFIDEVLGENGNDKNVLEALYHLPRLVREEGLIEQYLSSQKHNHEDDKREALRLTWKLIKNIFMLQNDGYASVLLALGLKYQPKYEAEYLEEKIENCTSFEREYESYVENSSGERKLFDDVLDKFQEYAERKPKCDDFRRYNTSITTNNEAFEQALSEICAMWKSSEKDYQEKCATLGIDQPRLKDRRKPQRDHILSIIELLQYPALQVSVDCREDGTEGLALAAVGDHANEFWGYNTEQKEVRKITRTNNVTSYAIRDCAYGEHHGPCTPVDVAVGGQSNEDFRIAVATQERYVLLYRLGQSEGQLELVCKQSVDNLRQPTMQSVVVCGDFIGWMTNKGKISLLNRDCTPVKTWTLWETFDTQYVRCSNDGTKLLVESDLDNNWASTNHFWGFAAINITEPGSFHLETTAQVENHADIMVKQTDFDHWKKAPDWHQRLRLQAGLGLDTKGNFFISASPKGSYGSADTGSSIGGIYQRLPDGKLRVIREYPTNTGVRFSDLAIDEEGMVFVEQEHWRSQGVWHPKCVHKYDPELSFENVKLTWTNIQ